MSFEAPRPIKNGEDVTQNVEQERVWPGDTVSFIEMTELEKHWLVEDFNLDPTKMYSVRGIHSDDEEPFAAVLEVPYTSEQDTAFSSNAFFQDESRFPYARKAPLRLLKKVQKQSLN